MIPRLYEQGRFYIGPNGFPRFIGSASGIHLADTLREEIASPDLPIDEAFINRTETVKISDENADLLGYSRHIISSAALLQEGILRERLDAFFLTWHPIFPFLDGAYVLQCFHNAAQIAKIEAEISLTSTADWPPGSGSISHPFVGLKDEEALVMSVIFLAIFSISDMDNHGMTQHTNKEALPKIRSPTHAWALAHLVACAAETSAIQDLFAIQGLLTLQLYLWSSREFRPALHVGGIIIKMAYEHGLHRCPCRFQHIFPTSAEQDIRKRVWYSIYILDRLLSAEFGMPLQISDTDIDVCPPGGEELHSFSSSQGSASSKRSRQDSSPQVGSLTGSRAQTTVVQAARPKLDKRLLAAQSLAQLVKITGCAMEQFNKTKRYRLEPDQAISLRTELDVWWNGMGLDYGDDAIDDPRHSFRTLFTCLYHFQIINLHRPVLALSSKTDSREHAHALQTAISSARAIFAALHQAVVQGGYIAWPGFVDMIFFGCLILVYAAKRERRTGGSSSSWLERDLRRAETVVECLANRWAKLEPYVRVVKGFLLKNQVIDEYAASAPVGQISPDVTDLLAGHDISDFFATDFTFDPAQWAFDPSLLNADADAGAVSTSVGPPEAIGDFDFSSASSRL